MIHGFYAVYLREMLILKRRFKRQVASFAVSPLLYLVAFGYAMGGEFHMVVKSHADLSLLTSFVITPMAFLGGTFFPLDRLPEWARSILYFLPLTHASNAIRAAALGQNVDLCSFIVLAAIGVVFFVIALFTANKARD